MKKQMVFLGCLFLVSAVLAGGCATLPHETSTLQPSSGQVTVQVQTPEPTYTLAPVVTAEPSAPAPTATTVPQDKTFSIPEGDGLTHELVFTIQNEGQYSSQDGRPAWLGWWASGFVVAPDGSFWLADTLADPDRLLHYSPQGELLKNISLVVDGRQLWAQAIAADDSGVWVLSLLNLPAELVHLGPDGSPLGRYEIPEEIARAKWEDTLVSGLASMILQEDGKLLLKGVAGVYEFDEMGGFQPAQGPRFNGKLFTQVEGGIMAGETRIGMKLLQPSHLLNGTDFVGGAPDGSFYILEEEINSDQGAMEMPNRFIRRYNSTGELLNIASVPHSELFAAQDLSVGSDGNVYWLTSHFNHEVEIWRLHFTAGTAAPLSVPPAKAQRAPFAPILPSQAVPAEASEMDLARQAMLSFFTALYDRKYAEAAALYGGSYDMYESWGVSISPDNYAFSWQNICETEICGVISEILDTRQVAEGEYEFLVIFMTEGGVRLTYIPCCGSPQGIPSLSPFPFMAKVKKVDGQYLLMTGPVATP